MRQGAAHFELEPYLLKSQTEVEGWLCSRLSQMANGADARVLKAMEYSLTAGGKRLRPILCVAAYEALKPQSHRALLEDAACALEFVHTYSLVHDDLPAMDDDDLRRGRPTSHKVFGEAMAILAGDALLTDAFTLLSSGEEPVRGKLVHELARAAGASGMVGGQAMDIAPDRPNDDAYLWKLHALKTGALIRAACCMGVLCAEGTKEQLVAAHSYGEAVGLAFQIADDVLDAKSDAAALGKPAGADARAGRYTFPAAFGLEGSERLARLEVEKAISAVARFPAPEALGALARYAVERKT